MAKTMVSWQAFPSPLPPRAPLAFPSRPKPPFPSLSNACHAGYLSSWARKQNKGSSRRMYGTEGKIRLGNLWFRLIWRGTGPASRGCFCLLEQGSKRKALLARWRERRKKKYDWVTCGKDLQSTPHNSNLHGKSNKSSSYRELKENSRD